MAYSLNLNGGAIQIPKITFTGDFSVALVATQQANGRFFCGGDNTSGSIEIYRNNSGIVALYIGTVGQFSGTTVLSASVDSPDTIVVARSGTSVTVRVNGTLQGTATFSGNMHISWFGLRQGWGNYPATMRFYSCNMQDLANSANSRNYEASLSNGTGVLLPTTDGTNAGTQFGSFPTDDSEWVFFASATEYTLTSDGGSFTYSGGHADLLADRMLTASGGSFSYSGASASLLADRALQADGGLFSYTGGSADLIYTEASSYVMNAEGGAFSFAGGETSLTYTPNLPNANADDFTVSAIVDISFGFESRISPTVGFSAMISSTFKFNGSLN